VVLHRLAADEQLGRDLRVRQSMVVTSPPSPSSV
jgi:hypothetical protein